MSDDRIKNATLDGLALIAAAEREDRAAVELFLSTYANSSDEERGELLGALIAHSVALVRCAAEINGVEPGKILGAVRASLKYSDD